MKNLLFLVIVVLSGCTYYMQVYDVKSTNTTIKENQFVFENDTVMINYSFWAEKGVMAFSIYNKLDKPIFVDWKNSSFVTNNNKLDYWRDEIDINSLSFNASYSYLKENPMVSPILITKGASISNSKVTKPERITFIPPKSNYYRYQFCLSLNYFRLDTNYKDSVVNYKYEDNASVKYPYSFITYDYKNSPVKFRNYIAFKFAENATDYVYIDNSFYVSAIKEMKIFDFRGAAIDEKNGHLIYADPFSSQTSFYINIGTVKTNTPFNEKPQYNKEEFKY